MAQGLVGCDTVPNQLFQFFRLRESTFLLSGEDQVSVDSDVKYPPAAGHQGHLADLALKGTEQFLCYPCGTQQPATLGTVTDFYARCHDIGIPCI